MTVVVSFNEGPNGLELEYWDAIRNWIESNPSTKDICDQPIHFEQAYVL